MTSFTLFKTCNFLKEIKLFIAESSTQSRQGTRCSTIFCLSLKEPKALRWVSRAMLNGPRFQGLWRQITPFPHITGFLLKFYPSHLICSNTSMLNFCYTIGKYWLGLASMPSLHALEHIPLPLENFLTRQSTWSQQHIPQQLSMQDTGQTRAVFKYQHCWEHGATPLASLGSKVPKRHRAPGGGGRHRDLASCSQEEPKSP